MAFSFSFTLEQLAILEHASTYLNACSPSIDILNNPLESVKVEVKGYSDSINSHEDLQNLFTERKDKNRSLADITNYFDDLYYDESIALEYNISYPPDSPGLYAFKFEFYTDNGLLGVVTSYFNIAVQ